MLKERKIVLGIIGLGIILGLVCTQMAFAFPNEPTGFRGNNWGTTVENFTFKVRKVKSIEEIKIDVYLVVQRTPGISEMVVTLDGKLAGMTGMLEDPGSIKPMAKALLDTYGTPTGYTKESVIWEGRVTLVEFAPRIGSLAIGSITGMSSVEALLEWYEANEAKKKNI